MAHTPFIPCTPIGPDASLRQAADARLEQLIGFDAEEGRDFIKVLQGHAAPLIEKLVNPTFIMPTVTGERDLFLLARIEEHPHVFPQDMGGFSLKLTVIHHRPHR